MAIEIKAPTYPESVQEGTLATWHKNVGDSVTRDELIVDIETDKVVLEVVAPANGILTEILKAEGDLIESNEIIARIEEGAAAAPGTATPAAKQEEADIQVAESLVNPAAKKLADERNIDLSQVTGTGKGGRITKEDVVNFKPAPAASCCCSSCCHSSAYRVNGRRRARRTSCCHEQNAHSHCRASSRCHTELRAS